MVSPKLFEQIPTARELTEQEISDLVAKFSVIFRELQKIIELANDMGTPQNDRRRELKKQCTKLMQ